MTNKEIGILIVTAVICFLIGLIAGLSETAVAIMKYVGFIAGVFFLAKALGEHIINNLDQ